MKTILITGATGFLGSHLAEKFLDEHKVIILKRSFSDIWRIKHSERNLYYYDIDKIPLEKVFQENKIDIVVHTATLYGRKNEEISQIVESNLTFPLKIFELALKYKIDAFINTDTFFNPDYKFLVKYSLSKKQFLEWLIIFSENIKVINIKLGHIFGEKDNTDKFIPWIITELIKVSNEIKLTAGEQKRDFIYIEDVKDFYSILINSLDKFDTGFHEYELGTGKAVKIKDFVLKLKKLTGNVQTYLNFGAVPYRENEIMFSKANISKIIKDFNWQPKYSLEEGLKKTIEWYRRNLNERTF